MLDTFASPPLPMTPEEVAQRGWDGVDVVFVTGDAYVDHPSFAAAILGRWLEHAGYRVAVLAQPDWRSCQPWRAFGRPRVCFAVSAGNMDSMVNHYTANRKVRNDDAYSPGGRIGRRPDRATLAYCQRAREAYPGVPIIAGGVEASLRRIAHYDYWSDKVRRSIVMDAKPDLVVHGMGERTLLDIVRRLAAGEAVGALRDLRGVAYRLGASETLPEWKDKCATGSASAECPASQGTGMASGTQYGDEEISPVHEGTGGASGTLGASADDTIVLPAFEEVAADRRAFARMTRVAHLETNPYCARRLVQYHGREAVVVNPPAWPLSEEEIDAVYDLPFTRKAHPSYGSEPIPALEVVRDSIQILRGCFGGCAFCSLAAHQGRVVQSRSPESILAEIARMAEDPDFKGTLSDLGGPTANLYRMGCSRPEVARKCRRLSCLHPTICRLLQADHGPLIRLMKACRKHPAVRRVFIASGVRTDLAVRSPAYVEQLVRHHVGGHLKVAPEHVDPDVLRRMKKPPIESFEAFCRRFAETSRRAGKRQYLVPYLMAGHPGTTLASMVRVAEFLKRRGWRVEQVQEFLPGPFDLATCMYHTGIDPMTGEQVYVPRGQRERRLQKALLLFDRPENHALVREALVAAGRTDLIGRGPGCLIADRPARSRNMGHSPPSAQRAKTPGKRRPRPPQRPGPRGRRPKPGD
ncbi:MAG: YgiQ family radical SAM protein [Pirellulales bacterium]|nr:YgiQ family radical SAM protein [Pirellulales bacterium]